jgi:GNAT superfamily N-acetyltransferase
MHKPAATVTEAPALPLRMPARAAAAGHGVPTLATIPAPRLRPVAPGDLPAMRAFVQALSPSSRRLRFHGGLKPDSDRLLRHLTGADGVRHVAWVAVLRCDDGDRIVGEARWVRTGEGSAEFAVAVADAWHGHGLAQRLLARLHQAAEDSGIATLTAEVLDDNARMATFLRRQGFEVDRPAGAEAGVRTWRKTLPAHAARSIRPATPGWKALASHLLGGWALPALSA